MQHDYIHFTFIPREPPSSTFTHMLFDSIPLHARSFIYMRYIQLHYIQTHAYTCTFEYIRRTFHPKTHSSQATFSYEPPSTTFTAAGPHSTTFSSPATFKYIPHTYILHIRSRPTFAHIRHIRSRHIRTAFSSFFPAATFCQPLAQLAHTHMCIATALTRRQTTHPSPTRMPAS